MEENCLTEENDQISSGSTSVQPTQAFNYSTKMDERVYTFSQAQAYNKTEIEWTGMGLEQKSVNESKEKQQMYEDYDAAHL